MLQRIFLNNALFVYWYFVFMVTGTFFNIKWDKK